MNLDAREAATRASCDGIVAKGAGRACKRAATEHFVAKNGTCVKHYCAQHAAGKGVMRMLLPLPWEYDHVETYVYYTR